MKTCCPSCQTIFRVTSEQIRVRAGKVRCGQCRTVFNAIDRLLDEDDSLVAIQATPQAVTGSVDAITFSTKLNTTKNAIVLDVRTPEEYASGYIGNAINIDYYKPSFKDEIKKLDKDKTYFV